MKFNELSTNAKPSRVRKGRGIAAGRGKTAGRGTKGQNARSGGQRRPGFEGGQLPLVQRIPKLRGFTSKRPETETVFTGEVNELGTVNAETLAQAGLISSPYVRVKLIAKGDVTKKLTVALPAASKSAVAMVQKAGGSFERVAQLQRPAKTADKTS